MTLTNPQPAQYRIRVDGFSVPAGSTAYDLVNTWVSPALGNVSASDANALRPAGSSWTASAVITKSAEPGAGRTLIGSVRVVDEGGTTLGTGRIVLTP